MAPPQTTEFPHTNMSSIIKSPTKVVTSGPISLETSGADIQFKTSGTLRVAIPNTGDAMQVDGDCNLQSGNRYKIGGVPIGGGTNWATLETPGGPLNGINITYSLLHTPISGTVHLFFGGQLLTYGIDFTISGLNIVMTYPPLLGDILKATYMY